MPKTNTDKNYYEILGVDEDADEDEIRKAYRKKAQKWHPDRSDKPNAEDKFKEIGEAYAVLSDPEKRKKYDQFRQYGQSPGSQGFQFDADGFDFFDLFQQAAGGPGGAGRGGPRGGRRQQQVDFEDLFGGRGGQPGGMGGQQTWQAQTPPGAGRAGRQPRGGQQQRQDPNVQEIERRIPFKLAALGGKLKVNTPSGDLVKLTIEQGTQPGTKLRVPKKGNRGRDLVVKIDVKVPEDLTDEQKSAIRDHF